jgi:hypothetical protein
VIARVRRRLGADLPLRALFQHPTIHALAGAVDRALGAADGSGGTGEDGAVKTPAGATIRRVERRRRSRTDIE